MSVYGVECCPHLGMRGDVSSYSPYPVDEAACYALSRPKGIPIQHQEELCLARGYALCPQLTRAPRIPKPASAVPSRVPLWVSVAVIFLTVGVAWSVLGLIDRWGADRPGPPARVSDEEWDIVAREDDINVPIGSNVGQLFSGAQPTPVPTSAPPVAARTAPATVPATPVRSPTTGPTYHVVKPGETLSGIAQSYGVTVDSLALANGMRKEDVLRAGARLTVPISGVVYVVQPGDTLIGVAQRLGLTVDALASTNELVRTANLVAGQHLIIPSR